MKEKDEYLLIELTSESGNRGGSFKSVVLNWFPFAIISSLFSKHKVLVKSQVNNRTAGSLVVEVDVV